MRAIEVVKLACRVRASIFQSLALSGPASVPLLSPRSHPRTVDPHPQHFAFPPLPCTQSYKGTRNTISARLSTPYQQQCLLYDRLANLTLSRADGHPTIGSKSFTRASVPSSAEGRNVTSQSRHGGAIPGILCNSSDSPVMRQQDKEEEEEEEERRAAVTRTLGRMITRCVCHYLLGRLQPLNSVSPPADEHRCWCRRKLDSSPELHPSCFEYYCRHNPVPLSNRYQHSYRKSSGTQRAV